MKRYRSTRGMKSSRRDRCTLHKKHLAEFTTFLLGYRNWFKMPATGHTYEVLHMMWVEPQGDGPHSFIYRNDHNDHLTVQADLVPYMEKWFKGRRKK